MRVPPCLPVVCTLTLMLLATVVGLLSCFDGRFLVCLFLLAFVFCQVLLALHRLASLLGFVLGDGVEVGEYVPLVVAGVPLD